MTFLHHHSNQSKACEQQKSSLKGKKKEKPQPSWAAQAHVLCCCRGVMACCAQKDFYEASQLHLFGSESIKLAEALARSARTVTPLASAKNRRGGRNQRAGVGDKQQEKKTKKKKRVEKTVEKNMCCLDRRASGCGWYICARCVS